MRGLGAAPALGPGGLDPDVQLAGRTAAKTRPPAIGVAAVKRAEFTGFDQTPKKKRTALIVGLLAVLFVAGLLNVAYFSRVHSKEARPGEMDQAGHGIVRIAISGKRALVVVTPLWAEHPAENWRPLAAALGKMGVEQAVVQLADGKPLGAIDVVENKPFLVTGVKPSPAAPPAPVQGATPGAVPATDKHAPKADEPPKADAGTAKK